MKSKAISRYAASVVALLLMVSFCSFPFFAQPAFAATQATYYVSPTGNDNNNGTSPQTPFRTIGKAQSAVRAINGSMSGDIVVYRIRLFR